MIGSRHRDGTLVIELDHFEKLEAPLGPDGSRQHWLPCEQCETLKARAWNVVSFLCETCYLTGPGPLVQCVACKDWLDPNENRFPENGIEHSPVPHTCEQESCHRTKTLQDPTWRCAGCGEEWPKEKT